MRITLLSWCVRLFERKKSQWQWERRYICSLSNPLVNKRSAGVRWVCYPSVHSLLLTTETKTREGGRLMLRKGLHMFSFGKCPPLSSSASSPLDKPSQAGINMVPHGHPGAVLVWGTLPPHARHLEPRALHEGWLLWHEREHLLSVCMTSNTDSLAPLSPKKQMNPTPPLFYMEIEQWCKTGGAKSCVKAEDLPCPYHIF